MTRTIAIANQKGGVGKTTTAVNLAACLAALQFRTLLVDLDPQGNASSGVGVERASLDASVYDVISGDVDIDSAILPSGIDSLDVLPSRTELAGAEVELVSATDRETILRRALDRVRDRYDWILVDCPPSLGLLTLNAFCAADSVLVPVQTEYYALEGLARLLDTIGLVRSALNPALAIEGLVLTMHDRRNNLARQVETEVRDHFGPDTFDTVIPRNVRLSESPSFGQPIILYDVGSVGARSYLALAREFVERAERPRGDALAPGSA